LITAEKKANLQVELVMECSVGRVRKARCQVIHLEKTVSQKIETAVAQTMNAERGSSWEHVLHLPPYNTPSINVPTTPSRSLLQNSVEHENSQWTRHFGKLEHP
jgi:hypothetical protein